MTIRPTTSKRDTFLWIVLAAGWLAMLVLIDPRGEFPLNDDWSYARAVKTLHETGRLSFPVEWASMTLIAQIGWGWLVTSLFGFSFFALRISTLVLAAAGIVGVYALLREARAARTVAFLAGAATAFNPWYMQLALSYMTDVPFLAATLWSGVFFLRALNRSSRSAFMIATGLALIATMIRQHGIFIALAGTVACLWYKRRGEQERPLLAMLPLILCALYLGVHQLAVGPVSGAAGAVPELHNWGTIIATQGWSAAFLEVLWRGAAILIYAGVLALPLWIYSLFTRRSPVSWRMGALAAVAILVPLLWQPIVPRPFDLVYNLGIGPPTLRDVYLLNLPNLPAAPRGVWVIFTALGLFGGAVLLGRWLRNLRQILRGQEPNLALILLTVFSLGCLALVPLLPFLDRYMLLLLPILWSLAVPRETIASSRGAVWLAGLIVFASAVFTTSGIHDYFAWNRARWQAVDWLETSQNVRPDQMDGGFEVNGWKRYDPNYHPQPDKSWWWVKDDEYMITFGPVPGYDEFATFPYSAWLPPGTRAIHALRRTTST